MPGATTAVRTAMIQFRFQTLLVARRHAEECLQKELAEARQALAAAQSVLRDRKSARRQCIQAQRRQQRQCFRGPDMLLFQHYLQRLEREIDAQQKHVLNAERKAQQKRQALIEAVKRRKMLEKLKQQDQERHLRALAERERKFIDEVAARRHTSSRPA